MFPTLQPRPASTHNTKKLQTIVESLQTIGALQRGGATETNPLQRTARGRSHFGEIAMVGSLTLAAAPVFFAHAVATISKEAILSALVDTSRKPR